MAPRKIVLFLSCKKEIFKKNLYAIYAYELKNIDVNFSRWKVLIFVDFSCCELLVRKTNIFFYYFKVNIYCSAHKHNLIQIKLLACYKLRKNYHDHLVFIFFCYNYRKWSKKSYLFTSFSAGKYSRTCLNVFKIEENAEKMYFKGTAAHANPCSHLRKIFSI